jgi:hypothetical protein
MSDQPPPARPRPEIQIVLDEATAQGNYVNLCLINHSDAEFVMDLAFYAPGAPAAKVRSRVILNPRHAKRLLRALGENIAKYEARFGDIDLGSDDPVVH